MTRQLIILGNGFDLQCGLKSSYKEFFRQAILDTIGEKFELIQTKPEVEGFWEKLLLEYYKKYGNCDYNWCDVETIIKDTLWSVYFGKINSSNINHGIWRKALDSVILRRNINDEAKNLTDPIHKFLFTFCGKFFYGLDADRVYISEQEKLHSLIQFLLQELHKFEKRFCKYIKNNIINPQNNAELNTNYIVSAVNLLSELADLPNCNFENINEIVCQEDKHFTESIAPNLKSTKLKRVNVLSDRLSKLKYTCILSFNYTALFDIINVESPCLYSNVHGKLCNNDCSENCKSSNIIFGIDNSLIQSESENTDLRIFSKTYRKMFDTSAPSSVLPQNNDSPLEIKFYGHSLSEADYSYFQSIFDYYNLYSNDKVSLIFYYSKGFEQNDEIYRLINNYGKHFPNEAQGKNLIHKLLLENRLKIVEKSLK